LTLRAVAASLSALSTADDHVRTEGRDRRAQGLGVRQVGIGAAERAQFAERRQRTLQLPANLAVFSKQENLHACAFPVFTSLH
jgi:hypothetical protein